MGMTLHCGRLAYTASPATIAELEGLVCWEWTLTHEPATSPERAKIQRTVTDELHRLEGWDVPNWVVNACLGYAQNEDIRRLGAGEALRRMTH